MVERERRDPEREIVARLVLEQELARPLQERIGARRHLDVHRSIVRSPAARCAEGGDGPDSACVTTRAAIDELRALQLDRLRDTVERVYEHVPHYRRAFDAAGVRPADLES